MGTGRSTDTGREFADERIVRTFLERAASVILESRTLDNARFDAVLALAQEVGLTREQLSCELRFLELRGVITSAPWDRLDMPDDASHDRRVAGPAAPPLPDASPLLARFREVVQQRLKPTGTLTAKARQAIEADGAALGLTAGQVAAALQAIVAHPAESPATDTARAVDIGLPAQPSPSETFRGWVKQKLAGYPSVILAVDDEQGLIGVGTHRYHLAELLALDIVRDVATAREMRLERDLDGASCHSTAGGSSQMSAELSELPELDSQDPRQLERREAFRSYLRRTLAQLPNGIVTFKTHRRLVEAGSLFHGVAPQWIQPTINEVASEIGSRFTSREQAVEHVVALVDALLEENAAIDSASRGHVYAEGTRWGLDPIDVEAIFRRGLQRVRLQMELRQQRVRRFASLAGTVLISVVVVLVSLFFLNLPVRMPARSEKVETHIVPRHESTARSQPDAAAAAWWSPTLSATAHRVATSHADLRAILEQACGADASGRGEAYARLVSHCLQAVEPDEDSGDLAALLAAWYAGEPAASAARRIPEQLLGPLIAADHRLPDEPVGARAAFWSARTAARIWKAPDLPPQRAQELSTLLATALDEPCDPTLELAPLENQCVAALARRYFAELPRIAREDADAALRVYRVLVAETANRVDRATLDQLDVDYLAAVLPALGPQWQDYRDVLRRMSFSRDTAVIQKLLEIWQQATEAPLREHLADAFRQRLELGAESMTDAELAETVRMSLEIKTKETFDERWQRVADQADAALRAPREISDEQARLQQIVQQTYLATLACALAQGEQAAASFQDLEAQGPERHSLEHDPDPAEPVRPFVGPYPLSAGLVVKQHIDSLVDARQAEQRLGLLRLVANVADTLADVDLASGQKLAAYLLAPKETDEQQQLLASASKLTRWNAVRLGMADHLAESGDLDPQATAVLRSALGPSVSVATESDRQQARRQLLVMVAADLQHAVTTEDGQLSTIGRHGRAIGDLYRVQAQLLQVPADQFETAPWTSAVLAAMITHLAAQLDRTQLSAVEQERLAALPHELLAAEFVAANDVQYTVMLERIWLRVLASHVAGRVPVAADTSQAIVQETLAVEATRDHVLDQLHDLETGILRLWMLCRPATTAKPAAHRDNELMSDGSTIERAVLRAEIEEFIRLVSEERLASLRPENPDEYRTYADQLAVKREDPDAGLTALRLYQIAAYLDPVRLAPDCVRSMIPLARHTAEERLFRAMTYLLDPGHDRQILEMVPPAQGRSSAIDRRQAQLLLKPLRALRRGNRREALALARRHKLKERLPQLTDLITYDEFEQACAPVCQHCTRGRQTCPQCQGGTFVTLDGGSRVACPACGASGTIDCTACGGDYETNPLPRPLLEKLVRLEIQWLADDDRAPGESAAAPRLPGWQTGRASETEPAPHLSLESLTEFDPRQSRYRDGRWVN